MPSYKIKSWTLSLMLIFITYDFTSSEVGKTIGNRDGCGERLERALDALQRDTNRRRNRLEDGESREPNYQEELRSAPLAMTITRIAVKSGRSRGSTWGRVEKCYFEPSSNSLKTRVTFNDISVSGTVSLLMREERRSHIPLESCRMTLRLRQAGVDIFTGTIARARGQMRIRTESSFLEPRFASLYAYGCHPNRHDKQLKRQDKWPPYYPPRDELSVLTAEPRRLFTVSEDVDLSIANESRVARTSSGGQIRNLGTWRNNLWITKSAVRRRRGITRRNANDPTTIMNETDNKDRNEDRQGSNSRSSSTEIEITPDDFVTALVNGKKLSEGKETTDESTTTTTTATTIDLLDHSVNLLRNDTTVDDCNEEKTNFKREYTFNESPRVEPRETLLLDENIYDVFMSGINNDDEGNVNNNDDDDVDDDNGNNRSWQSKEYIAREMEDIFLRGASRTLTSYIERQLHPAIKEALMISMGYTISYG